MNFAKVAETFPDVSTDIVCQLAEMKVVKPSSVVKLVPQATREQIVSFLQIAEGNDDTGKEAASNEKNISKPGGGDSQLQWLKKAALESGEQAHELDSPTNPDSQLMQELRKLIPPKDGGTGSTSVSFSEKFQDKILGLLGSTSSSTNFNSEHFEYIYEKLRGDPLARSRIENLHAARAHKYGHAQFGPKFWYRDSLHMATKWKSQDDRRKFRIGLKGLIDFLNQLNIMDLEKLLNSGVSGGFKLLKMPGPVSPETLCEYLKDAPPIKIIEFFNQKKAADILKTLKMVSSLAHFSQSMADYFARDDALEPALSVVCEVLRNDQDVGAVLEKRSATFMSLALPYDKHRSVEDRDVSKKTSGSKGSKSRTPKGRLGYCFHFQKKRGCFSSGCTFIHKCDRCDSTRHGRCDCRKEKRQRKSPSPKRKSRRRHHSGSQD